MKITRIFSNQIAVESNDPKISIIYTLNKDNTEDIYVTQRGSVPSGKLVEMIETARGAVSRQPI